MDNGASRAAEGNAAATIYHNPKCGTSRKVLQALRDAGHAPLVIEYLKTGWSLEQLRKLFADAGLTPRAALRTRGTAAADLGLTMAGADPEAILAAMVADPALVERPFVVTARGTRLCRPAERVADLIG